ncbi:MAG: metal-sulfur cluster assembly factor [Gemmatimonadaceae bacterium]
MSDETIESAEADEGARPPAEPVATSAQEAAGAPGGETVTEDQVRMALRKVKDPELNLNIVDLGLVYNVQVMGSTVAVDMSLTSPGCPSGPEIMESVEGAVKDIPGVERAAINLVWSPMWSPERIEPRVRAYLGF